MATTFGRLNIPGTRNDEDAIDVAKFGVAQTPQTVENGVASKTGIVTEMPIVQHAKITEELGEAGCVYSNSNW